MGAVGQSGALGKITPGQVSASRLTMSEFSTKFFTKTRAATPTVKKATLWSFRSGMVGAVMWLYANFPSKEWATAQQRNLNSQAQTIHQIEVDLAVIKDRLQIPQRPVILMRSTVRTNSP